MDNTARDAWREWYLAQHYEADAEVASRKAWMELERQLSALQAACAPFVVDELPDDLGIVDLRLICRDGEVFSDHAISVRQMRAFVAAMESTNGK